MNKSEIAEKAAREISKTLRSRVNTRWPVSHQQGWYEAANDIGTFAASIVERAIAESQAPQPKLLDHVAFSIAHGTFLDAPNGGCSCESCVYLLAKVRAIKTSEAKKYYAERYGNGLCDHGLLPEWCAECIGRVK